MKKFRLSVCGGTFDLLHYGHKSFITFVLDQSEKVIIGLTSNRYTSESKDFVFEDYETRRKNLEEFLGSISALSRVEIIPIEDVYGPLLDKNLKVQALFVTEETREGANLVNEKRESLGLAKLEIIQVDIEKAQDGKSISSSRVRKGEIDREGKLWINPDWIGKSLILVQDMREQLSRPFGNILNSIPDDLIPENVITIGDVTTKLFNEKNVRQNISIVDFTVKREKKYDQLSQLSFEDRIETIIVENPAGEISWDLFESIKKLILGKQKAVILVNGEEDLAVLAAVLVAPLGFKIYYGQPNRGLVEIPVDENKKEEARGLVSKFELS